MPLLLLAFILSFFTVATTTTAAVYRLQLFLFQSAWALFLILLYHNLRIFN